MLSLLFLAISASAFGHPAEQGLPVATGSAPLKTSTVVERLRIAHDRAGGERRRFVPAQRVDAGEELHYTIRVTNPRRAPVTDVVVTKRLPFGVRYAPGSAVGPSSTAEFSVDGGSTFAEAKKLRVRLATGGNRAALPADYTHVRWVMRRPLPPGATALLRFRASFE